jgi:hypothetical protein
MSAKIQLWKLESVFLISTMLNILAKSFSTTGIDEAEGYTRPDVAIACDVVEVLIRNGLLVRFLRPATEDGLASYDGLERRGQ